MALHNSDDEYSHCLLCSMHMLLLLLLLVLLHCSCYCGCVRYVCVVVVMPMRSWCTCITACTSSSPCAPLAAYMYSHSVCVNMALLQMLLPPLKPRVRVTYQVAWS